MNLFHKFENVVNLIPLKTAVTCDGVKVTYKELLEKIVDFSHKLLSAGIKKGERVCVILANGIDYIVSYYGTIAAGCIVVPVNIALKKDEIAVIVNDCSAKTIVLSRENKELSTDLAIRCKLLNTCIVDGDVIKIKSIDTKDIDENDDKKGKLDDIAAILYTSGTTGYVKGVMLSHDNLISNALNYSKAIETDGKDVHLCILPLSHSFAATVCMNMPLLTGSSLVVAKGFSSLAIGRICSENEVSVVSAVPGIFAIMASSEHVFADDFKKVKTWISGGAALSEKIFEKFESKFKCRIQEGYGLTEASPVLCVNRKDNVKKGTVGPAIPGVEIDIVDENFKSVSTGEIGQVLAIGTGIMKGYYNFSEDISCPKREGWICTGDVGKLDNDGHLYLIDRIKDMINVSGLKVYPKEVENTLLEHPCIKNAIVVGVPDILRGEQVAAQIVLKGDADVEPDDIKRFCRERLAGYKVPRYIQKVDEIKLSSTGKPMRNVISKGFIEDLSNL